MLNKSVVKVKFNWVSCYYRQGHRFIHHQQRRQAVISVCCSSTLRILKFPCEKNKAEIGETFG
jgi:hypothetical protein